ncbi:ATP-binding protein [Pelagibacterium lentulum]|uniref:Sugar translocase n=1 Tax=Pelagibacterium lentulum TaxID=2029865 RepID=A0A916RAS5_9HYPH|nr:AAA family ATPase [Pelagibacterium lentulum]GGA48873.1 sugar translocase [Pelagibacterium lentulum]
MRLRRLDLTRYGKFTDYEIDFGEHVSGTPDLHIVYGLNEAGKSTAASAYLDLLFGIEERTRFGFLHQGKAMEIGACVAFDGQEHSFRRVKQRNNSLLDAQGQPVGEMALSVPLAGLTRDAYRMMFSLDDQTLEDGGNAILESKGDLGELLFSASAGLAGISAVLEKTLEDAGNIFRKRATSTAIARLKREALELKSQRDEIDTQASAYRALTTALDQASAAYENAVGQLGAVKARRDELARLMRAIPLATDYQRGQSEHQTYKDLPVPPPEWTETLPALMEAETRLQTQRAGLMQREVALKAELEGLVVDEPLLALADRLDALSELTARYNTAHDDLPKRRSALTEWTGKIALILTELGQADVEDPKTLIVDAATIGSIRDLMAQKSGVDVRREAAERESEAAAKAIERAQAVQGTLRSHTDALEVGMVAQLQSILARVRQSDLNAELRLSTRAMAERQQDFDEALAKLQPWSGDRAILKALAFPQPEQIENWEALYTDIEARRSKVLERINALEAEKKEDEARIAALREAAGVIADADAAAALADREEAWQHHLASLDQKSAAQFEGKMRKTDALANARLAAAQELEELRRLTSELAVTTAKLEHENTVSQDIERESESLRKEIRRETPGEIALLPDASISYWLSIIASWSQHHSTALSALADLERATRDHQTAKSAIEAERATLATALKSAAIKCDDLALEALMQAADTLLASHATQQAKLIEANARVLELEQALADRNNDLEKAMAASREWQQEWDDALATTWFADRSESVGAIKELLDTLAHLPEALRERDNLLYRIRAMEEDQAEFGQAVTDLLGALGTQYNGDDPLAAARDLLKRYTETQHVRTKRQERVQALDAIKVESDDLASELDLHDARTKEMTAFFGVVTLAEVRQALDRCRKRDELGAQNEKLERDILSELNQNSIADALALIETLDVSALQQEHGELESRLEDLETRSRELFAEKVRATDKLDAIGGDDAVARIEARRRAVLIELEDLAIGYLRLRTGSLVAEHALRAYRDKHRSAMMDRASEAFRLITRDEYTGLATQPDKDRETLIGLSRHGGSKLATDMSKGTRFQLYLALRLAGYEEFANARPSVPFIADDIMETFDEPRSEEVFRLFCQMAQVGQVIYLTHHRHLCDIAKQVLPSVTIHEIS